MGFFKDLKEDLSQAVNELLPDENLWGEEYEDNDFVNTLDDSKKITNSKQINRIELEEDNTVLNALKKQKEEEKSSVKTEAVLKGERKTEKEILDELEKIIAAGQQAKKEEQKNLINQSNDEKKSRAVERLKEEIELVNKQMEQEKVSPLEDFEELSIEVDVPKEIDEKVDETVFVEKFLEEEIPTEQIVLDDIQLPEIDETLETQTNISILEGEEQEQLQTEQISEIDEEQLSFAFENKEVENEEETLDESETEDLSVQEDNTIDTFVDNMENLNSEEEIVPLEEMDGEFKMEIEIPEEVEQILETKMPQWNETNLETETTELEKMDLEPEKQEVVELNLESETLILEEVNMELESVELELEKTEIEGLEMPMESQEILPEKNTDDMENINVETADEKIQKEIEEVIEECQIEQVESTEKIQETLEIGQAETLSCEDNHMKEQTDAVSITAEYQQMLDVPLEQQNIDVPEMLNSEEKEVLEVNIKNESFEEDNFEQNDYINTIELEDNTPQNNSDNNNSNKEEPYKEEDAIMLENNMSEMENTETMETTTVPETATAADMKSSVETTVISKATKITGSITSDCSLEVLGTIEGNVECLGKLSVVGTVKGNCKGAEVYINTERLNGNIESEGSVKIGVGTVVIGDVNGTSAVIAGAVKGEVDISGPVVIDSTAIIKGNINAKSIQINNGAVIDGYCSLSYASIDIDNFFDAE